MKCRITDRLAAWLKDCNSSIVMKFKSQLQMKQLSSAILVVILGTGFPILSRGAPLCSQVHTAPVQREWFELSSSEDMLKYLMKEFPNSTKEFYDALKMARKIQELPAERQEQWVQAFAQAYRKTPKKSPNPMVFRKFEIRRLIEFILSRIENYPQYFERQIQEEKLSPVEAYRNFLARQTSLFQSNYDASAVDIVISLIQTELKELEKNRQGAPLKALIGGSFPNGKADMSKSDIDVSINDGSAIKKVQNWQSQLNSLFEKAGINSNLALSYSMEPASFFGSLSPIVIEITSSQVQLLVFPSGVIDQYDGKPHGQKPQAYLLNLGNCCEFGARD